jgi:TetR/AcrR family acrAB operon transcriptional repressor
MARKNKEDTEQTHQAILDSALETFYEKGFTRTTFDEIAKRINLTKGAVYWHFPSKTDLIIAIIKQRLAQQNNLLATDISSIAALRCEVIKRASEIEHDEEWRRFLFFVIYRMEWTQAIFNKVWPEINELCDFPNQALFEILQKIQKHGEIRADVDILSLQDILIRLWRGIIDDYIVGVNNSGPLSVLMVKSFDLIMTSITTEKK